MAETHQPIPNTDSPYVANLAAALEITKSTMKFFVEDGFETRAIQFTNMFLKVFHAIQTQEPIKTE